MYTDPKCSSSIDFIIMESQIDELFINSLNEKIDELLLSKHKISASNKLVGQIVKGEQLSLEREIKLFDKVHKLAEIMAEKYVNEYFTTINTENIYKAAKCIGLWSVHQFAGDYNPIHNHVAGSVGLSFIVWTKVPENMRNKRASNLYSASGMENGCTTFIGNTSGGIFDFLPRNPKIYYPKVGHFLIFPNWLNHYVNPFMCDGERRTIAGNIALYKSNEEYKLNEEENYKYGINFFGNGNPLKWKICQEF
ncbi:MAG: hypothetical protein CL572_05445 [Alphaproteobacteria bacterium]|nr:hypothetical protein [Alphaproteobacteria bacterium]